MAGDACCSVCDEPLVIVIDSDSEDDDQDTSKNKATGSIHEILDDVELSCGCHFHWECFLDYYEDGTCYNCNKDVRSIDSQTRSTQIICTVRNEGGVQHNFDIHPVIQEGNYLRAHPQDRKGHAYLEFCREGDVDAIYFLLKDSEEQENEDEEESGASDVLRFQRRDGSGTGLHMAIENNQQEVAWLLLALATELPWSSFPPEVLNAMKAMGIKQSDRREQPDLRTLVDEENRTPAQLAREMGGIWNPWLAKNLLVV